MLLGLRVVSQAAVGHPQRIVHRADLRVPRQDLLQQVGGPAVVLLEQRRLGQTVARRQGRGKQRQRLGEERLGRLGPALLQADVAQPEQRRRILGLYAQDPIEERGRLVQGAAVAVQLCEVIGPPDIVRSQRRRLPQAGLGLLGEPRRHEGHAHHADGLGRQLGRQAGPLVVRRQRGMAVANLRLHRFADPAQVRQRVSAIGRRHRDRRTGRVLRRRRRVTGRRLVRYGAPCDERGEPQHRRPPTHRHRPTRRRWTTHRHRPTHGDPPFRLGRPARRHQELPVPCSSVFHLSISTSSQISIRPSGQCTSTAGRASDSPRPTITRGSLAEA